MGGGPGWEGVLLRSGNRVIQIEVILTVEVLFISKTIFLNFANSDPDLASCRFFGLGSKTSNTHYSYFFTFKMLKPPYKIFLKLSKKISLHAPVLIFFVSFFNFLMLFSAQSEIIIGFRNRLRHFVSSDIYR